MTKTTKRTVPESTYRVFSLSNDTDHKNDIVIDGDMAKGVVTLKSSNQSTRTYAEVSSEFMEAEFSAKINVNHSSDNKELLGMRMGLVTVTKCESKTKFVHLREEMDQIEDQVRQAVYNYYNENNKVAV